MKKEKFKSACLERNNKNTVELDATAQIIWQSEQTDRQFFFFIFLRMIIFLFFETFIYYFVWPSLCDQEGRKNPRWSKCVKKNKNECVCDGSKCR